MDKLLFAQKFPFSNTARNYLKELDISLTSIPENAIKRAALIVSRSFSSSSYVLDVASPTKEMLELELVAFPVAKMFVSLMRAPKIMEKLASFFQKSTFNSIVSSSAPKDLCIELADDLGVKYSISSERDFFVEVPLIEYLGIYFIDEELKLVNKPVVKGRVILNVNDFARFLSEKAYQKIIDSLPIPKDEIPKILYPLATSIDSQLIVIEKKNFDLKLSGVIDPVLFPPCLAALYSNQLAGKKLSYTERLVLGGFLHKLGMSKSDLLAVFSKSPDFDKRIAEYHLDRIIEKDLDVPAFKKIHDEYGLRTKDCAVLEGDFKHPLQYYLAKLRVKNRLKNKSENSYKNNLPKNPNSETSDSKSSDSETSDSKSSISETSDSKSSISETSISKSSDSKVPLQKNSNVIHGSDSHV